MKLTQYISLLLLTGAAASVVSCTEMDDYLRFTEGVSSTYTGKLDSAVFLAGNGRLLFPVSYTHLTLPTSHLV